MPETTIPETPVHPPSPPADLEPIRAWLGRIRLGAPVHHHNLTVFPLLPPEPDPDEAPGTPHPDHPATNGSTLPGSPAPDPSGPTGGAPDALVEAPARTGNGSDSPTPSHAAPRSPTATATATPSPSAPSVGSGSGVHQSGPPPTPTPRYTLLADALAAGHAIVEEVSDSGSVPFLALKNSGALPILIPEGEILAGAKQDRSVNLTLLVPAATDTQLPVSCVESGRWHYRNRHFAATAYAHPRLRERKLRSTQANRRASGRTVSDQHAVWDEVEEHLHALNADDAAPTRSWNDGLAAAEERLTAYRAHIAPPAGACGFLAARGPRVVGLDLFDDPRTLTALWPRLADAYFVEAARDPQPAAPTDPAAADAFFAAIAAQLIPAAAQPALGFELELAGEALAGSGLWHDGALCHLAAFTSTL